MRCDGGKFESSFSNQIFSWVYSFVLPIPHYDCRNRKKIKCDLQIPPYHPHFSHCLRLAHQRPRVQSAQPCSAARANCCKHFKRNLCATVNGADRHFRNSDGRLDRDKGSLCQSLKPLKKLIYYKVHRPVT
jgi:hypothetical protein